MRRHEESSYELNNNKLAESERQAVKSAQEMSQRHRAIAGKTKSKDLQKREQSKVQRE